jgi:hypothetical protein
MGIAFEFEWFRVLLKASEVISTTKAFIIRLERLILRNYIEDNFSKTNVGLT